jgi:hypothetical protein
MKKHNFLFSVTICILTFIILFSSSVKAYGGGDESTTLKNEYSILVDLTELKLFLIKENSNEIIKSYSIASGKPTTPSPIGTWKIIGKASNWGKGFGSRWMALNVPWGRYGIHGTNKPLTIGGAQSLGCIRMLNRDIEDLYKRVDFGTTVVIYGGPYGLFVNNFRTLTPGNRGSDVYEVQRKMKIAGYYPWNLDGVYQDNMKSQVIKFRKDNNLSITHNIDREFYTKIGIKAFE